MKKLLKSLFLAAIMSLFVAGSASALDFRAAESVIVDQNVFEDMYIFGGQVRIDANVDGDLYIAGGQIDVNGNVNGDLVIGGGRVNVVGDIVGDIRMGGGQVMILGSVSEDVLIAGGDVSLGRDAFVDGDLLAGAGVLNVDGGVAGDLKGAAGSISVSGEIGGDMIVTVEDSVNLLDSARIGGNLEYRALIEADIPAGTVAGAVKFNQFSRENMLQEAGYFLLVNKLASYLASLILALIFVMFAPKAALKTSEVVKESILKAFGIGVLAIVVGFVAVVALMVTILGIPLAMITIAGLIAIFYFAQVFAAAWLASYFFNKKKIKKVGKRKWFAAMAFVLFIYQLLIFIPVLGWAAKAVIFFIGVGAALLLKKEYYMYLHKKGQI